MDEAAVKIKNLVKTFRHFQLGPFDLTIPKGAIFGLIGPNGAGKTTTLDMMMNMGKIDQGSIEIFGMDHQQHEVEVKRRIGYVSPELDYSSWVVVRRIVNFVKPYYPSWDDTYFDHLLEKLNIGWEDSIKPMSFGTKIKLSLILALSHRPDLLILDEPTLGLDAVSKKQIFSELLNIIEDEEHTIIISSHGLSDIQRFADHLGIIHDGVILTQGSTSEILERYCMVDFTYTNGAIAHTDGLIVQERTNDRFRALLDTQSKAEQTLAESGAQQITKTPCDLE